MLTIVRPHVAAPAAQAAAPDPRGYVCYRATSPVAVDGRLDDGAWRDAPWTDDFVDIEGDKKPRPTLRTRAKMLWDDTYFYIGAELVEPHVVGHDHAARRGDLSRQRLRVLHRPERRQPRVLRVRDQRARHRLGSAPAASVQGRRQGGQQLGDPRLEVGRAPRRHAQRRHRHGPRVVGGAGGAVERARRAGETDLAAGRRRSMAREFLAGAMGARGRERRLS